MIEKRSTKSWFFTVQMDSPITFLAHNAMSEKTVLVKIMFSEKITRPIGESKFPWTNKNYSLLASIGQGVFIKVSI